MGHRKNLQEIRNAWYEENEQYQLKTDQEQVRELKAIEKSKAMALTRIDQKKKLDDWHEGYIKRLDAYNYYSGLLKKRKH